MIRALPYGCAGLWMPGPLATAMPDLIPGGATCALTSAVAGPGYNTFDGTNTFGSIPHNARHNLGFTTPIFWPTGLGTRIDYMQGLGTDGTYLYLTARVRTDLSKRTIHKIALADLNTVVVENLDATAVRAAEAGISHFGNCKVLTVGETEYLYVTSYSQAAVSRVEIARYLTSDLSYVDYIDLSASFDANTGCDGMAIGSDGTIYVTINAKTDPYLGSEIWTFNQSGTKTGTIPLPRPMSCNGLEWIVQDSLLAMQVDDSEHMPVIDVATGKIVSYWTDHRLIDGEEHGQGICRVGTTMYAMARSPKSHIRRFTIGQPSPGLTVVAWIYPTDLTTRNAAIFGRYDNTDNKRQFLLWNNATGNVLTWSTSLSGSSAQNTPAVAGALSINTWYMIVATHGSLVKRLHRRSPGGAWAVSESLELFDGAVGTFTQTTRIGDVQAANQRFSGRIGMCGLWPRVLTANEIDVLWRATQPV